jgi:hypothetical protein
MEAHIVTPALPKTFDYNRKTRVLVVEYTDRTVKRFTDVDPRLAFLDNGNDHQTKDFLQWLANTTPQPEPVQQSGLRFLPAPETGPR